MYCTLTGLHLFHAYSLPAAELDDDFVELRALAQGFYPGSYGIAVDLLRCLIPLHLGSSFGVVALCEVFQLEDVAVAQVGQEESLDVALTLDLPKDTMISYEGQTVSELKEDFMGAVDDYLTYCKEAGITPRKSYSGSLNIRISPETHSQIAILAKQAGVSINAFIKSAVEKQVATML